MVAAPAQDLHPGVRHGSGDFQIAAFVPATRNSPLPDVFAIEPHRTRPPSRRKAIFPVSNETQPTNPLREGLQARPVPQPCNVVIFGASGDLTFRKLIPALYNLAADGDLPAATNIVEIGRAHV